MGLLTVDEALARVVSGADPVPAETVAIAEAFGCTLAEAPAALRPQPPFAASAMDGYAVRSEDARDGARLRLIGVSAAGRGFAGAVGPGTAVRILTGAPVPDGADTVVAQEDVDLDDGAIVVRAAPAPGRHIRARALDFEAGERPLAEGRVLSPRDVALCAAMGHAQLQVRRRPRVAVLATGDELARPGAEPGPDRITASSIFATLALAGAEGAEPIDLGIARDRLEEIRSAFDRARDARAEVLVTLGGASVGDHDLVRQALVRSGADLDFWKIAMRPGKPMMVGRLGARRVLGLPGNPVSSHVCAVLFLRPLIRVLLGRPDWRPTYRTAVLGRDLRANDQRQDYLRARLETGDDGRPTATPFDVQDSSMQRALAAAQCLICRPPHAPAARAGEPCRVLELDRLC